MISKIRPQIFLAVCCLSLISVLGITHDLPEISAGCIGGIVALGMRILEGTD